MTDYFCQVKGVFGNGRSWSTGRHITSGQTPAALLTTWQNAWIAAWTDGAHGLQVAYPVATVMESYSVATLDTSMRQIAKVSATSAQPGTDVNDSMDIKLAVVASWSSSTEVGRTKRGFQLLPAPGTDVAVKDKLTGPFQTRYSAAMNAIKAAITADGSTFFVFPPHATLHGIAPFTKSVMNVVRVRDTLGSVIERPEKEISSYL